MLAAGVSLASTLIVTAVPTLVVAVSATATGGGRTPMVTGVVADPPLEEATVMDAGGTATAKFRSPVASRAGPGTGAAGGAGCTARVGTVRVGSGANVSEEAALTVIMPVSGL